MQAGSNDGAYQPGSVHVELLLQLFEAWDDVAPGVNTDPAPVPMHSAEELLQCCVLVLKGMHSAGAHSPESPSCNSLQKRHTCRP